MYRHFPSTDALREALVEQRFVEMAGAARSAANRPGLDTVRGFIAESLQVFSDDSDFADAVVASTVAREETRALRTGLFEAFSGLITRNAEHFQTALEPADVMVLLCGLGYAARLRPERSSIYLDALFDGILAR